MAKSRDLDDVPNTSSRGPDRRKPSDTCDLLRLPDDKYMRLRLFGGVTSYGGHWVRTRDKDTGKWRQGNKGSFYIPCSAWDMEAGVRKGGDGAKHCAFCAFEAKLARENVDKQERQSRFSVDHYINAIVRQRAAKPPSDMPDPTRAEVKSGFKSMDSDSWTPVSVLRMTASVIEKLRELKQLNTQEDDNGNTQAYSVTNDKHGCDVQLMKRSKPATPADTYALQKGDAKPLTKTESAYLRYDLEDLADFMTQEEVASEFARWARFNKVDADTDTETPRKKRSIPDDEDDEDTPPAKKPAKRKPVDDGDDGFDDDDTPPPKKKKPVRDDEDDGFDDEDDAPKKPAPKKRKPADEDDFDDKPAPKKKKPADDFDEDEDEPPKKPAAKKKKPVDDEDEDDEDTPPPKKKKPAAKAELPLDDDDDDDFEDKPPPKKKKPVRDEDEDDTPPPKKPAPKKRKPADDEDDFDD